MMRYFIDTEFAESPGQLDLISIGIVAEDGRELYFVAADGWEVPECNEWVCAHVLPNLADPRDGKIPWASRSRIADEIRGFVNGDSSPGFPEFWGYYADYDWVAFCWLFGAMVDLPPGWPKFCRDFKQEIARLDIDSARGPQLRHNDTHNALDDARDLARNFKLLRPCLGVE